MQRTADLLHAADRFSTIDDDDNLGVVHKLDNVKMLFFTRPPLYTT